MKRKEFLRSTLGIIGMMLDDHKAMTENLFHWPAAKLGSIHLELNRDSSKRPEPFTEWDVMAHLPGGPPPQARDEQLQMNAKSLFYSLQGVPGVEMVLEPD